MYNLKSKPPTPTPSAVIHPPRQIENNDINSCSPQLIIVYEIIKTWPNSLTVQKDREIRNYDYLCSAINVLAFMN